VSASAGYIHVTAEAVELCEQCEAAFRLKRISSRSVVAVWPHRRDFYLQPRPRRRVGVHITSSARSFLNSGWEANALNDPASEIEAWDCPARSESWQPFNDRPQSRQDAGIGRSDLLPSIAILLIVLFHATTSVVLMVDGAAQYTECSRALFLEVRLLNFKSGLDQTR
jgi:hypothetical protein